MKPQELYMQKLITIPEAVGKLQSHQTLGLAMAASEPPGLMNELGNHRDRLEDIHVWVCLPLGSYSFVLDPSMEGHFFVENWFYGAADLPQFNLDELPFGDVPGIGKAGDETLYRHAAELIRNAKKVVVKIGNGGRHIGAPLQEFLELADGVAVASPISTGAVPASNERWMFVGGSKGSICGNYAMENADLLVAIGTRFVCQSDCSRTGYPMVENVINLNSDINDATHYNKTLALVGDAGETLKHLVEILREAKDYTSLSGESRLWLASWHLCRI